MARRDDDPSMSIGNGETSPQLVTERTMMCLGMLTGGRVLKSAGPAGEKTPVQPLMCVASIHAARY